MTEDRYPCYNWGSHWLLVEVLEYKDDVVLCLQLCEFFEKKMRKLRFCQFDDWFSKTEILGGEKSCESCTSYVSDVSVQSMTHILVPNFHAIFSPSIFPAVKSNWQMDDECCRAVFLSETAKIHLPQETTSFQKIASIAFPSFPTMSIQHCRMTAFSSALSRIGRQSTRANNGPTTIVSRCWNQKSMSPPVSSSIRNYAIMVDASQATMVSSHSQKTNSHNFFRSLESFFGLQRSTAETAITTNSPSSVLSWAIWLIKRTYQPSLLKKKRQCGYMKRKQTVGGRRILKRRRKKGRKRLFGA